MIRPTCMQFNKETSQDNIYMQNINFKHLDIQNEFRNFQELLNKNGIETVIYNQQNEQAFDSIFCNNWISTHKYDEVFKDSFFVVYPMKYKSRQIERNEQIIKDLKKQYKNFYDLDQKFRDQYSLEGTGSLIFDLKNTTIYCSLSQRAQIQPLQDLQKFLNQMSKQEWNIVTFELFNQSNQQIYHTNIAMAILGDYFLLSTDCLKPKDQDKILHNIQNSKHKYNIININKKEVENFCGNMIFATNNKNENFVIMSKRAQENLNKGYLDMLSDKYKILCPDLENIENIGGGSARCMLAELF